MNHKLVIGWLYPELMSTYGDRGNIITLQKRCEWRGIGVEVKRLDIGFDHKLLTTCNLLFMGGAQDQQQKIVAEDLQKKASTLKKIINEGIPGLYICGAYQFLGKYYKEADGTIIKGLGILDLYTENPGINHPRLIGNIIIKCHPEFISGSQSKRDSDLRQNDNEGTLVGFENHGGRTYLGKNIKALGRVVKGFGNNGIDKTEGAIYKNSFGSYLHGPILPKNPSFADLLIKLALEKKYGSPINLSPLDNSLETQARKSIAKRLSIEL
ncbi:MAG: cobalamin biosynthesis protein CobQ [Candidatus Levybacteria bacterium]|nr:cobalamin biosynthesis protein CobQ [Candidatus Levybacteria bacterium]